MSPDNRRPRYRDVWCNRSAAAQALWACNRTSAVLQLRVSDLSPQNRVSEEVSSSLPLLHDLVISNISGTTRGQMCQCKVTSQELRQYTAAVLSTPSVHHWSTFKQTSANDEQDHDDGDELRAGTLRLIYFTDEL